MKARRVIKGANFDPETLSVVFKALDAAWAEIADHYGELPRDIESGRVHIARAILIAARYERPDIERLKTEALQEWRTAGRAVELSAVS